jgi:pantothenate kinase
MCTLKKPEVKKIEQLVDELIESSGMVNGGERFMLGITGYPGAGKSTVAGWLAEGVNKRMKTAPAIVVPMDGYHYSNERLTEMALLHLKGIPETFDSQAFVALLRELRTVSNRNVYCPLFDRSIEASIERGIVIEPRHRLCIVDGNYLLLRTRPWDECTAYLNEVWFLDVSMDTILERLQRRHMQGGRTPEDAMDKVESTDLPNARLIETTRSYAHRLIAIR